MHVMISKTPVVSNRLERSRRQIVRTGGRRVGWQTRNMHELLRPRDVICQTHVIRLPLHV